MATYKIVYRPSPKSVLMLPSENATPGGYTDIGTFEHDDSDTPDNDNLGFGHSHVLYHHIRDVLYSVGVESMQGVAIAVTVGNDIIPIFTTDPSFTPSSGQVGDTFTANNGVALNAVTLGRRWLLSGTSIGTGVTIVPNATGNLELEVTATSVTGNTTVKKSVVGVISGVPTPTPTPTPSPTLGTLMLSGVTIQENVSNGAVVGNVLGKTLASTLSLTNNAGGAFSLVGSQIVTAGSIDFEANTFLNITIRETLADATNSPNDTIIAVDVTNVFESATLNVLSLSNTNLVIGTASSGTITGATVGSTIVATNLPSGLTINGAARTFAWSGTGSPATSNITLTETLGDSPNSPRANIIAVTVAHPSLVALTLSNTNFVTGTATSGVILGSRAGSVISGTNLPTGFTINSLARTWAWSGSGSAAVTEITLTETLAGSPNSPRDTAISLTVTAPATFPAPVALGSFANRAALVSPNAAFTDAASSDNPFGQSTVIRWTSANGASDMYITPSAILSVGVDVRNGTIHLPHKMIQHHERLARFQIELHSAGTPSAPTANYHQMDQNEGPSVMKTSTAKAAGAGPGRWSVLGVPISDFDAVGTGADLTAIKFVRLKLCGNASYNTIIEFGSPKFQLNVLTKAKAMFSHDDGAATIATTYAPAFEAKGWKMMFNYGARQLALNQAGKLSTAQTITMKDAGHQNMLQAEVDELLATHLAMNTSEQDATMQAQKDFWTGLGGSSVDVGLGSYFSQVDHTVRELDGMFQRNQRATRAFGAARGVTAPDFPILYGLPFPFPDRYLVQALPLDAPTTLDHLKQHAEQAILNKGIAFYAGHADYTNLQALLDWFDLPEQRARIDVIVERDLFTQYPYV